MRRPASRPIAAFSLLALLLLAPAAAPQDAKAAAKALKTASKAALKELKAAIAVDTETLLVDLATFDAAVAAGPLDEPVLTALFGDLRKFQEGVLAALFAAAQDVHDAAQTALVGLAAAEGGAGPLPPGFRPGDGGALDAYREAARKLVDKSYAKLRGKLRASAGRFQKVTGRSLAFRLEPPAHEVAIAATAEAVGFLPPALTVDVALAARLDDGDSGKLYVGGVGSPPHGAVTVSSADTGLQPFADVAVAVAPSRRWGALLDDEDAGLPADNYLVTARQGASPSVPLAIAVP